MVCVFLGFKDHLQWWSSSGVSDEWKRRRDGCHHSHLRREFRERSWETQQRDTGKEEMWWRVCEVVSCVSSLSLYNVIQSDQFSHHKTDNGKSLLTYIRYSNSNRSYVLQWDSALFIFNVLIYRFSYIYNICIYIVRLWFVLDWTIRRTCLNIFPATGLAIESMLWW